ncbi:hypothetical protein J3R30DRAFT_3301227, partial [Lentinula aciculospora]
FSQDGTLTDSIAAIEDAWGQGRERYRPRYVIAATHEKRTIDNPCATQASK